MDVELANAPAMGQPDWNLFSETEGLGAIEEFNASFQEHNGDTIDPRITTSNPTTPNNEYSNVHNGYVGALDQAMSPYSAFQPQFDGSSPYYHSVEANPSPVYQPSPLRFHHRRSISEPPAGLANLMPPTAAPMVLHRDNHCLGHPMNNKAVPLKSMPKASKQQRHHPYPRKARESQRPDVRRAQTQPGRPAPTSMPRPMPPPFMPSPMMIDPHAITSRVCTPTPEGPAAMSPNIDPALNGMPSPMHTPKLRSDPKKTLLIPLTVDELRAMVFEAVQKAVGGIEAKKGGDPVTEEAAEMAKVESENIQNSSKNEE